MYEIRLGRKITMRHSGHGVLEYWAAKSDMKMLPPSVGPAKKSIRRADGRARLRRADLAPPLRPSGHPFPVRQRAGGTRGTMPVRPAGFILLKGKTGFKPVLGAQTWKSNVPPRPDNEPLKNGNERQRIEIRYVSL